MTEPSDSDLRALKRVIDQLALTPPLSTEAVDLLRTTPKAGVDAPGPPNPHEDDLGEQVSEMQRAIDCWFVRGEQPPVMPALRIAIILRRCGKTAIERAFLAVWCLHFGDRKATTRDIQIRERARNLAAWPL